MNKVRELKDSYKNLMSNSYELKKNGLCNINLQNSCKYYINTYYEDVTNMVSLKESINSTSNEYKTGMNRLQSSYDDAIKKLDEDFERKASENYNIKDILDGIKSLKNDIEELIKSIAEGLINVTTLGDEIVKKSSEASELIDDLQECTTIGDAWGNNMLFNPTISYEYKGYASTGYNKGTFKQVGNVSTKDENIYCYGTTDGHYDCVSGIKIITNGNDVPQPSRFSADIVDSYYYTVPYFPKWTKNGEKYVRTDTSRREEIKINLPKGIEKTVTKTATYAPSQNFKTYHQYGTIVSGEPCSGLGITDCLWTRLPETALPVELKTGRGAFPFKISVSNIGQYSNNTLGRLVGNPNSVLVAYNKEVGNKCSVSDEKINGSYKTNFETLTSDVGYVCGYINNCDSCGVSSCTNGSCELECSGSCKMRCKNCVYDGSNSTFKYRTVSNNNVFPNSCTNTCTAGQRNTGYNWSNYKGQATINEIQSKGDSIYESASYSYTLTPAQLRSIRDYNRTVGTYSNTTTPSNNVFKGENALKCEQMTVGNITYSVKCLSTFLNVKNNTYFTTNARDTSFTLWTESDYCKNNACPISREDGIGPSWK